MHWMLQRPFNGDLLLPWADHQNPFLISLASLFFFEAASSSSRVAAGQSTVPSRPQLAMKVPSREKATPFTGPTCPLRVRATWCVATCHSFSPPPSPAEAKVRPSGVKARDVTLPVWAFNGG